MLSNLLQELALARDHGQKQIVLDEARLNENPVSRLSRMIRNSFWSNLTRRIDGDGLEKICADPKVTASSFCSPAPKARLLTLSRRCRTEVPIRLRASGFRKRSPPCASTMSVLPRPSRILD